MSGQTVDNTLQLNQQGGGRIDIPLPENSGEELKDYIIETTAFELKYTGDPGAPVCFYDSREITETNPIKYTYGIFPQPVYLKYTRYWSTNIFYYTVNQNYKETALDYLDSIVNDIVPKNIDDGTYNACFLLSADDTDFVYYWYMFYCSPNNPAIIQIEDGVSTVTDLGVNGLYSIDGASATDRFHITLGGMVKHN